jgi:hypothetical protein
MPGTSTATLLKYATIVDVDMDATNDVNFADVQDYGHRVVIDVDKSKGEAYLAWARAIGQSRPKAVLSTVGEANFKAAIISALNAGHVDVDGVTSGLHFGSDNLSTNPDARIRKDGAVSANDIPLCFVLNKLYGSSAASTLDMVYNLEDAYDMLSSEAVATAIVTSLKANEATTVDRMFRDLVAADPHRFFDASGIPAVGMFETNDDVIGSGSWKLADGDILEIKTKFIFKSKVTRRGVAGNAQDLTGASPAAEKEQIIINPGDYFFVRIQLKMSAAATSASV